MNGILILDKPAGWTSQDAAARLRRVFGTRRVGHGGTLDPMATGVLPIFVGRATRGVEFFAHEEKTYEATLRLGVLTDTQDTTGRILETRPVAVSEAAFLAALEAFRGDLLQTPPMYSAIKIQGKRLYELARAGKTVDRPPRRVTIHALDCLEFSGDTARIRVRCSGGTYIRTLCQDIGLALGCGGCMAALRRTAAGGFTLNEAVTLDTLLASPDPGRYLRGVDCLFAQYPAVTLTPRQTLRCRNGNAFSLALPDGLYRAYSPEGEFLMLGRAAQGVLSPVKSFFEESTNQ